MKQEDRELLLADLCARLPYGVMIQYHTDYDWKPVEMYKISCDTFNGTYSLELCKPYLRPMSSMTEEECIELDNIEATIEDVSKVIPNIPYHIEVVSSKQIDWLNAHHFDHRNLIERGLAIAVTEENDPYKE